MNVRSADEAELDHVAKIWYDAWRDAHEQIVPAELTGLRTLESFRERLRAALPDVRVVGEPGEPVGFCVVKGAELYQLFVAAPARGSGAAAVLIADAEDRLAENGVTTAWLACAIGNERAARFYEKRGWRRAGTMVNRLETANGEFALEVWRYEKDLSEAMPPGDAGARAGRSRGVGLVARSLLPSLILATLAATASAQNPLARMAEVRRQINAGNAAAALALLDSLAALAPDHPNVVFLRAHANGLAGRHAEARADLAKLLRWDARFARLALRDTNVAALRREFADVDSLARLAERPISLGSVWATIAERDLVAEGTAWDPATRSVLVGSLNKHKIVAIAPDGSVSDRVAAGASGLRSVVGIHVDSSRGILWAASNARFDTPNDSAPSALFAFDARTGAFKSRLTVPVPGRHFLNDVTTGPDGTVYVTDSEGWVWHAAPGASELRELTALGRVLAPNGITISGDGRVLFVSDADHIQALEIRTGSTWRIATPDSVNVAWIDGLAFAGGALIAHHPLSFWRIARYPLDRGWRRIEGRQLLEANTPDGRTSTTGEVVGEDYVYIGNSQIDRMNAKTIDPATMEPIRIYRVRLSGLATSTR
jgi:ribosomal protein S18 acetylase RimI-like enzyme